MPRLVLVSAPARTDSIAGDCRLPSEPALDSRKSGDRLEVAASGAWTTIHGPALEQLIGGLPEGAPALTVDVAAVSELDTLGATLLDGLVREYQARGRE